MPARVGWVLFKEFFKGNGDMKALLKVMSSISLCMFYSHKETRGYMANKCICFCNLKYKSSMCAPVLTNDPK
jgi:hypothetical protein